MRFPDMAAHILAAADQAAATVREAHNREKQLVADDTGYHHHRDPGPVGQWARHQLTTRARSDRVVHCPHLLHGLPAEGFWWTAVPDLIVCEFCTPLVGAELPKVMADYSCDRCHTAGHFVTPVGTLLVVGGWVGGDTPFRSPVIHLRYMLCGPCFQLEEQGVRAAPDGPRSDHITDEGEPPC